MTVIPTPAVTEAEIEAAARAIAKARGYDLEEERRMKERGSSLSADIVDECVEYSRAALAAAAKERETEQADEWATPPPSPTVGEQLIAAAQAVLARDAKWAPSGSPYDCNCIGLSASAEQEYETGTCPHQRLRAALTAARQVATPPASPSVGEKQIMQAICCPEVREVLEDCHRALNNLIWFVKSTPDTTPKLPMPIEILRDRVAALLSTPPAPEPVKSDETHKTQGDE